MYCLCVCVVVTDCYRYDNCDVITMCAHTFVLLADVPSVTMVTADKSCFLVVMATSYMIFQISVAS